MSGKVEPLSPTEEAAMRYRLIEDRLRKRGCDCDNCKHFRMVFDIPDPEE